MLTQNLFQSIIQVTDSEIFALAMAFDIEIDLASYVSAFYF